MTDKTFLILQVKLEQLKNGIIFLRRYFLIDQTMQGFDAGLDNMAGSSTLAFFEVGHIFS